MALSVKDLQKRMATINGILLDRLCDRIDSVLTQSGGKWCRVYLRSEEDMIKDQVIKLYRNLGWIVTYEPEGIDERNESYGNYISFRMPDSINVEEALYDHYGVG